MLKAAISSTPWSCGTWRSQSRRGRLIQGLYKPIHGNYAIYFYPAERLLSTLPETNSSPLKMDGWKTMFPIGEAYFQGNIPQLLQRWGGRFEPPTPQMSRHKSQGNVGWWNMSCWNVLLCPLPPSQVARPGSRWLGLWVTPQSSRKNYGNNFSLILSLLSS